jgi:ComF family protein
MLHTFKYKGFQRRLTWSLGYLFYSILKQVKGQPDMLIPIPLHKNRQKQRGFNQARTFLNYYCAVDGKIPIYNHLVSRILDTEKQALALNSHERILNISGAFMVKYPHYIKNKHIIIVDDVITTGATANELAKVLKLHGASQVDLCVLLCVKK